MFMNLDNVLTFSHLSAFIADLQQVLVQISVFWRHFAETTSQLNLWLFSKFSVSAFLPYEA